MKKLKHPNVVMFLGYYASTDSSDADGENPVFYIVTQYVARGSLFRLLHR